MLRPSGHPSTNTLPGAFGMRNAWSQSPAAICSRGTSRALTSVISSHRGSASLFVWMRKITLPVSLSLSHNDHWLGCSSQHSMSRFLYNSNEPLMSHRIAVFGNVCRMPSGIATSLQLLLAMLSPAVSLLSLLSTASTDGWAEASPSADSLVCRFTQLQAKKTSRSEQSVVFLIGQNQFSNSQILDKSNRDQFLIKAIATRLITSHRHHCPRVRA